MTFDTISDTNMNKFLNKDAEGKKMQKATKIKMRVKKINEKEMKVKKRVKTKMRMKRRNKKDEENI